MHIIGYVSFAMAVVLLKPAPSTGYRALVVATVSTKSHYIFTSSITQGLLDAGHQVVELTNQPPAQNHPNRTSFIVDQLSEGEEQLQDLEDLTSHKDVIQEARFVVEWSNQCTETALRSKASKKLIEYLKSTKEKFDVMIVDYPFQQATIGFATLTNYPPIIAMTAFNNPLEMSRVFGNPILLSFFPNDFTAYDMKMKFWERINNVITHFVYQACHYVWYWPRVRELYVETFGSDVPSIDELEKRVVLGLTNSHPAIHGARPMVPSIIEIGGIQTTHIKPLPKDIKDWLDSAKDGVIFMSFGSMIRSDKMSPEKRRVFLNTFKNIKQKVLWKFESDDIQNELPPNVKVGAWLPQSDILAHPNVVLFISHCGGLSTQEASFRGVPILGVPFFVDQLANAEKIRKIGTARILPFPGLNEKIFQEALQEMISNTKYLTAARRLSNILTDQPESPRQRAVWWVEHVARHEGADHLRSPARDMSFVQVFLLDVAALVAFVIAVLVLAIRAACRAAGKSRHGDNHSKRQKRD